MRGVRRRWAALSLLLATFVAGCQAAGPAVTRPPSAEQSAAVLAAAAGPAPSTAEPTMGARAAVDVLVASPTRSLTQLPFYVGLAAGLFAEEGLNATMI